MPADKTTTIVVNGQEKHVEGKELSFDQVADLAFPDRPTGPNIKVSITYRRGTGNKPEGILAPGQTVKVKEGMRFDVELTDKS